MNLEQLRDNWENDLIKYENIVKLCKDLSLEDMQELLTDTTAEKIEYLEDFPVLYVLFERATEQFKEQYGHLLSTGYSNQPSEDGGIYGEDFETDLVEDKTNSLRIDNGGWFSMDLRGEITIYCLIGLKIDGKTVGECEAFNGWYNIKSDYWKLEWGDY